MLPFYLNSLKSQSYTFQIKRVMAAIKKPAESKVMLMFLRKSQTAEEKSTARWHIMLGLNKQCTLQQLQNIPPLLVNE